MARRVTPSQLRSKLRQADAKRTQAIDKYNRAAKAYNQKVNQAVNQYNSQIRAHNSRVRANRNRLRHEIDKLARAASKPTYTTFRTSVETVHRTYDRLESVAQHSHYDDRYNEVLDLSEREAANNAGVMNALMGNPERFEGDGIVQSTALDSILSLIAADLGRSMARRSFLSEPQQPGCRAALLH